MSLTGSHDLGVDEVLDAKLTPAEVEGTEPPELAEGDAVDMNTEIRGDESFPISDSSSLCFLPFIWLLKADSPMLEMSKDFWQILHRALWLQVRSFTIQSL